MNSYTTFCHTPKLRDKLLNRELFLSLAEARCVLDEWRLDYNHHRPHSSLDWQTPAAFAAKLKDEEAVVAFSAASPSDPPVGAAPLPLDLPAPSTPILSPGISHMTFARLRFRAPGTPV